MTDTSRKICFVTGSRADFGLLVWPMRAIRQAPGLTLQLIATGMHLSPEFGYTVTNVRDEGFDVDESVETLLSSDSGVGVAKSVGLGVIGFADAFARLKPDLVVVLGDRYETLAAAQAAMFMRLPMAHLFGGDVTEGVVDESTRHAISKMSHLHFTSNKDSTRRLMQLGEHPSRIHTIGSPGIDAIKRLKPMDRETIGREVGMAIGPRNALVTFHPLTIEAGRSVNALDELFAALSTLDPEFRLFFTLSNADAEGRALNGRIEAFVASRPNTIAVASLGQLRYISLMNQVDVVIGNSSSGVLEAPSLNVPTVDIGDRQKGREHASSVFNTTPERNAIVAAISKALIHGRQPTVSPYGDGESSQRFADVIAALPDFRALLKKGFYDIPPGGAAP
ncbi:UDP-N-acetylglucosamine 2-epimerase [Bradyrhizobium canariense]|uniref:UDP-N-acetylglucosamine 2-epimerase (Non-hydrolysing)/GDP/UDP-N,N'-diacetylbacillosamine 2-epimerase (Hydrolysing) n=1 Tax=Bradyrhizobium canariense TaxID=255045 RepID=A0A1H1M4H9_9BRAD|nr:UDP-N-acetylglucosamine 2-epimerase [Bradyrhizobium canariense]SDR81580.1 UDP-N-acetylglucosamine 2-epimerase (non-hydrolysing)/GDP/UDP-N,N'-diacetylbacillosamine 2-epimerase (hydrolysing) [Bradyrhizobium canariense]